MLELQWLYTFPLFPCFLTQNITHTNSVFTLSFTSSFFLFYSASISHLKIKTTPIHPYRSYVPSEQPPGYNMYYLFVLVLAHRVQILATAERRVQYCVFFLFFFFCKYDALLMKIKHTIMIINGDEQQNVY